jgi:hypothetical protein
MNTDYCEEWIIDSETSYWTNNQQNIVSNCVDLSHHFIEINSLLLYYYYLP